MLVALQRCRAPPEDKAAHPRPDPGLHMHGQEQIAKLLEEHQGCEEFQRLAAAASTRRLLLELREAHTEEREPELDLVLEALAQGANPNAQEEAPDAL